MARITQKKTNRRKLFLLLVTTVVVIITVLSLVWYQNYRSNKDREAQIKTQDEAQTGSAKNNSLDTSGKETQTPPSDSTTEEVENNTTASIIIDSFSQEDHLIKVSAHGTNTTSAGPCVFQFSATDSRPVVKQVAASNGVCTVSIAETEFDKIGSWTLKVTYYVNDSKTEATRDVTIQ